METVIKCVFDQERALYGQSGLSVIDCTFDGPADGESALKECYNINVDNCRFHLRYPMWHINKLKVTNCNLYDTCRAPLWYSSDISITDSQLLCTKALRECNNIYMKNCTVLSQEFGWYCSGISIESCNMQGEYMFMRSRDMVFNNFEMTGKYSFQYIENAEFNNCTFDTKDAFWHAKNIYVKNCTVTGEYLGWYCENVTFENCTIKGTQPLCYCNGLKLINCEMHGADFAFEKSDVEASVTTQVISIKNPLSGKISVPKADEIICDNGKSRCEIIVGGTKV